MFSEINYIYTVMTRKQWDKKTTLNVFDVATKQLVYWTFTKSLVYCAIDVSLAHLTHF